MHIFERSKAYHTVSATSAGGAGYAPNPARTPDLPTQVKTPLAPQQKKSGKEGEGPLVMPMYEALARLEGRTPVIPPAPTWGARILRLEQALRSDVSLGALKTAAAAITFATILLAPVNLLSTWGVRQGTDLRSLVHDVTCSRHAPSLSNIRSREASSLSWSGCRQVSDRRSSPSFRKVSTSFSNLVR